MSSQGVQGAEAAELALTVAGYEELRALIADKFGIDYPPRRQSMLATRVGMRVAWHGFGSFSDYCAYLRTLDSSAPEWDELAEVITNSETYFFREPKQFEQLAQLLRGRRGAMPSPLRVLSAGCSSGEEAYSLAMVVASVVLGTRSFEVHGVDVTPSRLAKAREGRYPLRRLNRGGAPPAPVQLDKFGRREGDEWRFSDWLRDRVAFHQRNLVDPRGLELGSFDIVFCRNVLIYAQPDRIRKFVRTLTEALAPGGYLFLGASEPLFGGEGTLEPVRLGDQFAYVRANQNAE